MWSDRSKPIETNNNNNAMLLSRLCLPCLIHERASVYVSQLVGCGERERDKQRTGRVCMSVMCHRSNSERQQQTFIVALSSSFVRCFRCVYVYYGYLNTELHKQKRPIHTWIVCAETEMLVGMREPRCEIAANKNKNLNMFMHDYESNAYVLVCTLRRLESSYSPLNFMLVALVHSLARQCILCSRVYVR